MARRATEQDVLRQGREDEEDERYLRHQITRFHSRHKRYHDQCEQCYWDEDHDIQRCMVLLEHVLDQWDAEMNERRHQRSQSGELINAISKA